MFTAKLPCIQVYMYEYILIKSTFSVRLVDNLNPLLVCLQCLDP